MKSANLRQFFPAAVLMALLAVQGVSAAPREGTLGNAKAGAPILSKEQLRTCVAQQKDHAMRNLELSKRREALTAERAELDRTGVAMQEERAALERGAATLKSDLGALDQTKKDAVDVFNERSAVQAKWVTDFSARAAARDKQVDSYEPRLAEFNVAVESLKTERAAWGQTCDGRRYLEDDYNAIKAGR